MALNMALWAAPNTRHGGEKLVWNRQMLSEDHVAYVPGQDDHCEGLGWVQGRGWFGGKHVIVNRVVVGVGSGAGCDQGNVQGWA